MSMDGLRSKVIASGFVLALLTLIAIGASTYNATRVLVNAEDWVGHNQEVLQLLGAHLVVDLTEAQSARRGFVISGDGHELERYQAAAIRIEADIDALDRLTSKRPAHQREIEKLKPLVAKRLALWRKSVAGRQAEGLQIERERAFMLDGRALNVAIQQIVRGMQTEEATVLSTNLVQVEASANRALLVLIAGTVASIALLAAVFLLLRREIGQRTHMEAELRLRTAALEAVNKELESFSYSVSHDLRNPLGVIEGFSELLVEEHGNAMDETAKGYVQRIRAVAAEMAQLIKDLLQFSLAQRSELRHESVDLSVIADSIVEELCEVEPARQVTFVVARGLQAIGDRGLLDVVLRNLIGNAWKFTTKQPAPRIEVGSVKQRDKTVYFVRDNGIGFNMDDAAKVFSAFHRLPAAQEFSGSGIGLATVQRIIQRHGGRIWAAAAAGRGATFYFTL